MIDAGQEYSSLYLILKQDRASKRFGTELSQDFVKDPRVRINKGVLIPNVQFSLERIYHLYLNDKCAKRSDFVNFVTFEYRLSHK